MARFSGLLIRDAGSRYTARDEPLHPQRFFPMTASRNRCDVLLEARWCVPVSGTPELLERHAVAIEDGRIAAVLPIDEAREKFDAGVVVSRPHHVLIPGLVNTHTHAAMTLMRGYAEDMPLDSWLIKKIWPAEKRWVSAEMVRDGTRHAVAEMLKNGVTCFSDQYFFPDVVAKVAADCEMRAVVATPVIDFETAWADNGADCLQKAADRVHDPYADHPLVTTAFAPHTTSVLSDETFRALRVLADQLDRPIQIHLHESASEIAAELKLSGERPLARLERLGFLNASLLGVHCVHLDDAEIDALAAAGASVAHCPRSNLKLASGIARLDRLRAAGLTVGLGTDGAASNNELDLLGELRAAALLVRGVSENATALGASDALQMATLDGARALGLGDVTGSLEAGKQADIACIDMARINSQPLYDPLGQLVYTARAGQVTDTWVAGRQLVENGELTTLDELEILERSKEWRRRIAAE